MVVLRSERVGFLGYGRKGNQSTAGHVGVAPTLLINVFIRGFSGKNCRRKGFVLFLRGFQCLNEPIQPLKKAVHAHTAGLAQGWGIIPWSSIQHSLSR